MSNDSAPSSTSSGATDRRPTKRIHVYIYEDQIEDIFALWPRTNLSDVIRKSLDRLIEKAREQQANQLNPQPEGDPTID